ncbi:hypothetical protein Afil01_10740 [Actinorhabdospora filicis]|uniref:Uncharacterized protein n=1 Tax=Actinorhabdospora filicis TaxID=1785913 RepID=A0A9W6W1U0_9ACTN|nr:hypothetical protein [Actinorhabdospora filicis]GLZ76267.1 hypothetical protein Afil01_10740 [Actinorhabdospora filicis]
MSRLVRRLADATLDRLVPRSHAGACPSCQTYPHACPGGYDRVCCYHGSHCNPSCGCP